MCHEYINVTSVYWEDTHGGIVMPWGTWGQECWQNRKGFFLTKWTEKENKQDHEGPEMGGLEIRKATGNRKIQHQWLDWGK